MVARAGEVPSLLRCCYCQKVQHIGVELLLSYSDEGVLVIVDLLVVAYVQLVVRLPLDL